MRIDRADEPDDCPAPGTADTVDTADTAHPAGPDKPAGHDARGDAGRDADRDADRDGERDADRDGDLRGNPVAGSDGAAGAEARAAHGAKHRATVDAAYRAYAIDQGYERIREVEHRTVTPAMRRIEAEDPSRHLAGLEHRLKGKERLTEKITNHLKSNPELSPDQAFSKVKDAIRYTYVYSSDHYAEGVQADVGRLEGQFELVDLRNSWPGAEYKGINSRWRVPENGQLFEVQFHTEASFDAKQFTHVAYEKIRDPATSKGEREKLQDFQRQVSADIPVPPHVDDIRDRP